MKDLRERGISNEASQSFLEPNYWDIWFQDEIVVSIIKKFLQEKPLKEKWNVFGAATVSEAYKVKEVIFDSQEGDSLRMVNTGTIDPYVSLWGIKPMQYIKGKYLFPRVNNDDLLKISKTRLDQSLSKKIIVAGMSSRIEAIYDEGGVLAGKSTSIILGDNLKALLGIVNSKLISFCLNIMYNSVKMAGGFLNIGVRELNDIRIPGLNDDDISSLERDVCSILQKKSQDKEEKVNEELSRIDLLVYHLYGLTYDEVLVVDPHTTFSREEYER